MRNFRTDDSLFVVVSGFYAPKPPYDYEARHSRGLKKFRPPEVL